MSFTVFRCSLKNGKIKNLLDVNCDKSNAVYCSNKTTLTHWSTGVRKMTQNQTLLVPVSIVQCIYHIYIKIKLPKIKIDKSEPRKHFYQKQVYQPLLFLLSFYFYFLLLMILFCYQGNIVKELCSIVFVICTNVL